MRIAVVTGASSGLGSEYVRRIAQKKNIDEIWAIARREDRLMKLRDDCPLPVRAIPMDLTLRENIKTLAGMFAAEKPDIAYLVCAAGFGKLGYTKDLTAEDNDGMIDLNCRAAVDVTAAALPYIKRGGRILEICSTAGNQPMPGINVYAATKAFLTSYTKALHHELFTSGIHVTAVCPYWIKDTEFIPVAKQSGNKTFRHFPLASHRKNVVMLSLAASACNFWVSSPGIIALLHRFFAKFVPHFIMVPLIDLLRRA